MVHRWLSLLLASQAVRMWCTDQAQRVLWLCRVDGLKRISDLKLLHHGSKPMFKCLLEAAVERVISINDVTSTAMWSGDTGSNSPVASDLAAELLRQLHKVPLIQLSEPWMGQHHAPCHDGRDFAVEVQLLAEVQQRR
jgi:hypothetical protein